MKNRSNRVRTSKQNRSESSLPQAAIKLEKMDQVGNYIILEEIGKGGMGIVYKARDTRSNMVVALKLMLGKFSEDSISYQRFIREISSTSKLNHKNVIKVYDCGVYEESPYMVMQYIDGETLIDYCYKNDLSLNEKLSIIKKVAETLHFAHKKKMVHRDIKPSNILIDKQGEPFLMDFGLVKRQSVEDKSLTQSGEVIGTPKYMSPEQARGLKREVDAKSDLYSLSSVLFHILIGHPWAQGETLMEILHTIIKYKPPKLRKLNPDIPQFVEEICLKGLEKEKKNRYANAQEFSKDIDNFLKKRTTLANSFYKRQKLRKVACFLSIILGLPFLAFLIVKQDTLDLQKKMETYYNNGKIILKKNPEKANIYFSKSLAFLEKKFHAAKKNTYYKKHKRKILIGIIYALYYEGKSSKNTEEQLVYFSRAFKRIKKFNKLNSKQKKFKQKLEFLILQSMYEGSKYKMAYKKGLDLLKKEREEKLEIKWITARASYYYNTIQSLQYFQELEKEGRKKSQIYVGSLFYQGRIYFHMNNVYKAKQYFAKALKVHPPQMRYSFTYNLYLYYSNTLFKVSHISEAELEYQIKKYFVSQKKYFPKNILYKETLSYSYIYAFEGKSRDRKSKQEMAKKIITMMDQCIETEYANYTQYQLRGIAYTVLKNHQKALDDFTKALEIGVGAFDVYTDKLRSLSLNTTIDYHTYDYQILIPLYDSLQLNLYFFNQEIEDFIKANTAKKILLKTGVKFTEENFAIFYKKLHSESPIIQKVAQDVFLKMKQQNRLLKKLRSMKKIDPKSSKLIDTLCRSIEKRQTDKLKHGFLLRMARVLLFFKQNPEEFNTPEKVRLLKKIFLDKKVESFLRYFAATLLIELGKLEYRQFLFDICNDKEKEDGIRILALVALFENKIRFKTLGAKLIQNYSGNDPYVKGVVANFLGFKGFRNEALMKEKLSKGTFRDRAFAASTYIWKVPSLTSQCIKILLKAHKHIIPEVRTASISSLWNASKFRGREGFERWQLIKHHFPKLKNSLYDSAISVQQITMIVLKNLVKTANIKTSEIIELFYKTSTTHPNQLIKWWSMIALTELTTMSGRELNIQKASIIDGVATIIGLGRLRVENEEAMRKVITRILKFINTSPNPQVQSYLIYFLSYHMQYLFRRANNEFKLQFEKFLIKKIRNCLRVRSLMAHFFSMLAIINLEHVPQVLLNDIYRVQKETPFKQIKILTLGILADISQKEGIEGGMLFHKEALEILNGKKKYYKERCAVVAWGYYHSIFRKIKQPYVLDRNMSGRYKDIVELELSTFKKFALDEKIRYSWINRLEKAVDLLKDIKNPQDKRYCDYIHKLSLLYVFNKETPKAIQILTEISKKNNWSHDKITILLMNLMLQENRGKEVLQFIRNGTIDTKKCIALTAMGYITYLQLFGKEKAEKLFEETHGISPSHPVVQKSFEKEYPKVFIALAKHEYARKHLEKAFHLFKKTRTRIRKADLMYGPNREFKLWFEYLNTYVFSASAKFYNTNVWAKKHGYGGGFPIFHSSIYDDKRYEEILVLHKRGIKNFTEKIKSLAPYSNNEMRLWKDSHTWSQEKGYASGYPILDIRRLNESRICQFTAIKKGFIQIHNVKLKPNMKNIPEVYKYSNHIAKRQKFVGAYPIFNEKENFYGVYKVAFFLKSAGEIKTVPLFELSNISTIYKVNDSSLKNEKLHLIDTYLSFYRKILNKRDKMRYPNPTITQFIAILKRNKKDFQMQKKQFFWNIIDTLKKGRILFALMHGKNHKKWILVYGYDENKKVLYCKDGKNRLKFSIKKFLRYWDRKGKKFTKVIAF